MTTYETPSGPGPATDEPGAKDKAVAVADDAQAHAAEVAGSAKEHGLEVVDEAKAQARDLVGETRGRLRDQADEQARTVAAQLAEAADDLLAMSRGTDNPDHPVVEAARQLGEKARQLSDHLDTGGFGALVADAKRFARRRPLAFIGTSLAAGLLVGRILRNADTSALTDAAKPVEGREQNDPVAPAVMSAEAIDRPQPTILAPTVGAGTS